MKFSCEKALLQAAISTTSRAVSPKSSIPALEGILLEAGSDLRLTGYNLETGIRTIVPADIREEGTLVLGARLFGEIIRKLPDDIVTFQSENYMVNIKCGMSEFNILGTDPEEFPELPTVEYQNSLILPQSRLKAMISQTLFAVSDNESRPIHTGSLFEVDSNGLTIVSVDGYRLALRHEAIDKKEGTETFSFVVPGAALSEVEKICSDVDEPASVTQGARHVMFKVGDTMLVSRRLEGEFLAYRQAIPRNNTIHVEGDTRALLSSIDRVSLIISDKLKSPLRCVFDSNLLKISTKTAIGDAYDECPLSGDGGGLEIGFNNKYLMDALKAAPADKVRLELTTGVSPCVILPTEGEENFLYMVLPVRLKAGE
ncbi:DNA polymerase III subunit beta [Flavonifractor plautii]|uniref:Beta sliding clamp n=1 Tax=Flavonifractor plautii TaxID=292800 RepID=A0AAX1KNV3_FLAPL|nr:DNA polymerase III subunit beta [Flavonifractor plautii]ANU42860.1 DNA polymerase III subunit beta [Flavonifractor plautii]OXE46320.1 DNA polymerase III subunit beta [Flavonifractor plautii]QQR07655.1 DNA polymerase III subunit beta [Flavonifractor plautii]UQA25021.1 DNA polymerase III subunit beta [Flavonifractor plautii]